MRSTTYKVKVKRTLVQFAKDKRRVGCPICAMTPEVKAQLKEASNKKISLDTQLEWLLKEIGVTVSAQQLNGHRGGRHEEPA